MTTSIQLASLVSQPTEIWSQLAAAVVALTVGASTHDVESHEALTVIERPTGKEDPK